MISCTDDLHGKVVILYYYRNPVYCKNVQPDILTSSYLHINLIITKTMKDTKI